MAFSTYLPDLVPDEECASATGRGGIWVTSLLLCELFWPLRESVFFELLLAALTREHECKRCL
jgi:hypothetical protein